MFDAAIELYSHAGWAGFNFEAITRATGIGKAALYRRWPGRAELLVDTLKARWYTVNEINTGRLRDDLLALTRMFLDQMTSRRGNIHLQIMMDTENYDEVRDATAAYRTSLAKDGRAIVRRAVDRGELPAGTSPTLIIDMVVGGIQNHVVSTPPELRAKMEARMHEYGEQLVDAVLTGTISHREP